MKIKLLTLKAKHIDKLVKQRDEAIGFIKELAIYTPATKEDTAGKCLDFLSNTES